MITARIETQGRAVYALREGELYREMKGDPFSGMEKTERVYAPEEIRLLAPVQPSKILAVGKNYAAHAREFDGEPPASPIIFMKPSTCVIGPEETIVRPRISQRVDYEGELALVVGKLARNVKPEDYAQYVLGYTILNDVTARDLQRQDGQWTRGKGFDTFAPIGPVITDEVDPSNLRITTRLNGKTVQDSNTSRFLFSLGEIFAFVTRFTTLLPGDVVTTGTPEGVGGMADGDVVEVCIEGIGTLRNVVKDEIL